MTDQEEVKNIPISNLIQGVEMSSDNDLYSNHVQVTLSAHELFLDFYYLSPAGSINPRAKHVQRMLLPAALAKGLATAIANTVAVYEKNQNIVLPNSREKQPGDLLNIWE